MKMSAQSSFLTFQWLSIYGLITFFISLNIIGWIDANCVRINDYFKFNALIACLFQILDVVTDIYFIMDVYNLYHSYPSIETIHSLHIIRILSVAFIIIPSLLSLIQLNYATKKHFMQDDKIRAWLNDYCKTLYFVAIITGSSFTAIKIFNSNLLNLSIFDMGLSKQYSNSFHSKRIYSTILLENFPQILLQLWYIYMYHVDTLHQTTILSLIFSGISVFASIISTITTKRIYNSQDYIQIRFDATGQCIIENARKCRNRFKAMRSAIAIRVFGINDKLIEIQRPYFVKNGLRISMNISVTKALGDITSHDPKPNKKPRAMDKKYQELLDEAKNSGQLHEIIKMAWKLPCVPIITNAQCKYVESKDKIKEQKRNDASSAIPLNARGIGVDTGDEDIVMEIMKESLDMSQGISSTNKSNSQILY